MTAFHVSRRRCTAVATLTSADRSVTVEVSLLESRGDDPPQVRVVTRDGAPHVVGLRIGTSDPSVVEIDLAEQPR